MDKVSLRVFNQRAQSTGKWCLWTALFIVAMLPVGATAQRRGGTVWTSSARISSPSVSTTVVINEIYAGAGCTTAACSLYGSDYVELKNIGTTPVNITGWTIQYKSATGTTTTFATSNPLSGVIQAGDTFLVVLGAGAAGTGSNAVPTGNGTGTLALSNTAGRIALVNNSTPLDATTTCAAQLAASVDYVGYGATAVCFEGAAPAPAPTSTSTSLNRLTNVDTDQNGVDFGNAAPTPKAATTPTAAGVTVAGRVLSADGRGIRNAFVSISGGDLADVINVRTGPRGEYSFNDIPSGQTYTVTVQARRFSFDQPTQVISPQDSVGDLNFVAGTSRR